MKGNTLRMLAITQFAIVITLLLLTLGNEIFDLPHYIFQDAPTLYSQRIGEIYIELTIFSIITVVQGMLLRKLYRRIRMLEGFLLICANCKKIKNQQEQWEQLELYITEHSCAQFSHGICPECIQKLYPDYYNEKIRAGKENNVDVV
jgi:hypothetical protein